MSIVVGTLSTQVHTGHIYCPHFFIFILQTTFFTHPQVISQMLADAKRAHSVCQVLEVRSKRGRSVNTVMDLL